VDLHPDEMMMIEDYEGKSITYIKISSYVKLRICIHIYVHVYIYTYIWYECMHLYIYTYVHMHNVYIYEFLNAQLSI
jgi:hypothetical protein